MQISFSTKYIVTAEINASVVGVVVDVGAAVTALLVFLIPANTT